VFSNEIIINIIMQYKVLAFLTFNVSTCINRTNVHNSINRYDRFTHMCTAGFADGIQIIAVIIGDIWIISY